MDKQYEDRFVVYVLLNDKLNRRHMIPQCGHAVAEMMAKYNNPHVMKTWAGDDRIMVCLKAPQEDLDMFDKDESLHSASFREGHWDDMITGIAFYPMKKDAGRALFSEYPLA